MKSEQAEHYVFLASIVLVAALVAFIFLPELNAIVLGVTFAVLFQPLYGWLVKKMPKGKSFAALVIVLLTIMIICVPLIFFGLQMFSEATGFYASISSGGSFPVIHYLETKMDMISPTWGANLNTYLQQFLGWIMSDLGALFSGVASMFFAMILSFFALYYLLRDGDRLHNVAIRVSPLRHESTELLLGKLHLVMSSIIRGTLLMSVFYGIAAGLGFFIFGLPNAIFWGAVSVFASFIPLFGTYTVIIPGMIILIIEHHYFAAIGLFVWIATSSILFENYLRPLLIGRKVNIHPLLILFSVVGGLSFFGPLGVLLGPLALGVLLSLIEIYPVLTKE